MSFAYEIENWLHIHLRRKSWTHPDAYWYRDRKGNWKNQRNGSIDPYISELFTCDDWEPAEMILVFDWVLIDYLRKPNNFITANPDEKTATLIKGMAEGHAPEGSIKIKGSDRLMTKAVYERPNNPDVMHERCMGLR